MGGVTNFPTAVDDDASLYDVADASSAILAAHHNNLKAAMKIVEAKIGVYNTTVPTSLDYRLGHPSSGHSHNGASGQGPRMSASAVLAALGDQERIVTWQYQGSIPSGASLGAPLMLPKTMQLLRLSAAVRRAPSGATLAFDVNFGASSIFGASQGLRPILAPGTIGYLGASPNLVTYPSGARIIIDADAVGTSEPGTDASIVFIFKE